MRIPFIAGNWKMNTKLDDGIQLAQNISSRLEQIENVDVAVFPPFTHLQSLSTVLLDSGTKLGAQDCHCEVSGAFTGDISAPMLHSVGCDYVILGHSERRQGLGESNQTVNKKIKAALSSGLMPVLCIGEILEERESDKTMDVIKEQFSLSWSGVSTSDLSNITLAYEPVWAIGTGKTATPAQAEEVHAMLRELLHEQHGEEAAKNCRILYGGSVKPENSAELLACENIDGALVGGASLNADSFIQIIETAQNSLA